MKFTDFCNEINSAIANAIPFAELKFTDVSKATGDYYGLSVNIDDSGICPVLNLTEAFDQFESGTSIEDITDRMIKLITNLKKPSIDKDMVLDWELARTHIYPRLINTSAHSEYLESHPHIDIADLSICYAVRVEETSHGIAEAVIDSHLLDHWNVSVEDIQEAALENLSKLDPIFSYIEDVIFGSGDTTIETARALDETMFPLYVLTTPNKHRGATLMLSSKVMEAIIAKLGDVYILPSSVDEVLIVPKSIGRDVSGLAEMVRSVNASDVQPEDQLSDHVYEYDIDSKSIVIAA